MVCVIDVCGCVHVCGVVVAICVVSVAVVVYGDSGGCGDYVGIDVNMMVMSCVIRIGVDETVAVGCDVGVVS